MNVYHRLLNILAETSQPEYWTIDELIHCLALSQKQFVIDTEVIKKNTGLLPKFDENEPASRMPVTITTIPNRGLYQIPQDCMKVKRVYYQGKLLDKVNIDGLNSYFAGNSHFLGLKGIGYTFTENWREFTGEPRAWVYDNGIRITPCPDDKLDFTFNTLPTYNVDLDNDVELTTITNEQVEQLLLTTRAEVTSKSKLYWQFARLIKTIDGVNFYDEGQWEPLEYNKDYFVSSAAYDTTILFSDETIGRICKIFNKNQILPTILIVNPSKNAFIEYIPEPSIEWNIKTLNDKGVELQVSPVHGEGIACYAAYLALSKEGKKSQDIEKATIYLQRYQEYAQSVKSALKGSVNINYAAIMPFNV